MPGGLNQKPLATRLSFAQMFSYILGRLTAAFETISAGTISAGIAFESIS